MNCIFCDIAQGIEPVHTIYQTDSVIAFLDHAPFNYGHTLVIPKVHYDTFLDMPGSEAAVLIQTVHIVANAVTSAVKPSGTNILTNNGTAAGQAIKHCHFHIIPRYSQDGIAFRFSRRRYSATRASEYAQIIQSALQQGVSHGTENQSSHR